MRALTALCLCALLVVTWGDNYLHRPAGSNNRLAEKSANRDNGDRLFDSQNNNRGGYNVGDKTHTAFDPNGEVFAKTPEANFAETYTTGIQYNMGYFEGSEMNWEWTNQHGCGGRESDNPNKLNCNLVFEYICDTDAAGFRDGAGIDQRMEVHLRDGKDTNTPDAPGSYASAIPGGSTYNSNQAQKRGRHESEAYWYACRRTQRNYGLFHADQRLNGRDSTYTRQNQNGNRRGLECAEERDYFPYWSPSPWITAGYFSDDVTRCDWILNTTQNYATVYVCDGLLEVDTNTDLIPINEEACLAAKGTWKPYSKNLPKAKFAPECGLAPWSRTNHLGDGVRGQPLGWNFTLPYLADLKAAGYDVKTANGQNFLKCVARMRYNMTTDDYDPWNTYSDQDDDPNKGVLSPVRQNPTVDIGADDLQGLRLAINTNQFGRTFQDRSHIFYLVSRPAAFASGKIYNLNVRGKRGNIVQTYPSVEYDFIPNRLQVRDSEYVHIQWTGSNTHNNGNPAGDGQAGDAGEGTGGTDRNNFVLFDKMSENYPVPLDKAPYNTNGLFASSSCFNIWGVSLGNWADCAITLATSGKWRSIAAFEADADADKFSPTLDDAPASLVGGVLLKFKPHSAEKSYNYLCTRNNNFSNRSQKGTLIVTP